MQCFLSVTVHSYEDKMDPANDNNRPFDGKHTYNDTIYLDNVQQDLNAD